MPNVDLFPRCFRYNSLWATHDAVKLEFHGSGALAHDAVVTEVKAPFARSRSLLIESHGSSKPFELVGRLSFGGGASLSEVSHAVPTRSKCF